MTDTPNTTAPEAGAIRLNPCGDLRHQNVVETLADARDLAATLWAAIAESDDPEISSYRAVAKCCVEKLERAERLLSGEDQPMIV